MQGRQTAGFDEVVGNSGALYDDWRHYSTPEVKP